MIAYFVDSSALVKRYIRETGTDWVRMITRHNMTNYIYIARITIVEVTAAIARRRDRTKTLSAPQAASRLARFRKHLDGRYIVWEQSSTLLADATKLANSHALRAYDAVQLAAAIEIHKQWINENMGGIIMVSADQELNDAANTAGLMVEDPNAHP